MVSHCKKVRRFDFFFVNGNNLNTIFDSKSIRDYFPDNGRFVEYSTAISFSFWNCTPIVTPGLIMTWKLIHSDRTNHDIQPVKEDIYFGIGFIFRSKEITIYGNKAWRIVLFSVVVNSPPGQSCHHLCLYCVPK